ncbi:hypothetical protein [Gluconobacter oxydans]|uniref:hypothetical protein n=1 Tax=Gluconobacter oxydans TaxID=442 RepID=UPI001CD91635|nr:hypothetical protein [Gluconobacter oxydans]
MKNGIAWGVGAGALIMGLGVFGLSLRNPQGVQAAATRPDPCGPATAAAQRPQNCSDSGRSSGAVYVPRSSRKPDDDGRGGRSGPGEGGSGEGGESSAGHAGFGESAGGHAGGGE